MKEPYITFPLSDKCVALTTTRELGNLAYQVDEGKDVRKHRYHLSHVLNIPSNKFTFVHQSHSDLIEEVTSSKIGKGKNSFEDGLPCDALYTKEKGVPLCIFHADCVPLFFINEKLDIVGIIHSGFKGTLKHITYKAINEVIKKENAHIEDFKFFIGPYRTIDSFSIDEQNIKDISEANLKEAIIDHHFDNGLAVCLDLKKLGTKEEQIRFSNLDTVTDHRFYSAYLKTPVGRLVSLIYLK